MQMIWEHAYSSPYSEKCHILLYSMFHYGVLNCVNSQVLPMGPYELLQGGS